MLSQLSNWFRSHALKPAVRFAAGRPRFRGQFEQLEARTVLSASIGPQPLKFELGHASVGESPFAQTVGPNYSPASAVTTPHWEDSPPLPLSDAHDFAGPFDTVRSASPYDGSRDVLAERPASIGYVMTVYISAQSRPPYQDTVAQLNGKPITNSSSKPPLALTNPPTNWASPITNRPHDSQTVSPQKPQMSNSDAAQFSRLLAMPFDTSDEADRTSKATVRGRDSAFQSYSNGSLLLATTLDGSYDADFYRTPDDRRNTSNEDAAFTALHESALDGDELSLDALQHERESLDAVFAVLSDLEGRTRTSDEDEPDVHESSISKPQHVGHDEAVLPNTMYAAAIRHDLAQGGMVLLEPAGDSNIGAYDVIQAIAGTGETRIDMRPGVEASIGIYQAFDVGTTDLPPTTTDAAPLSTRPAAGQSNASAEVAPAKRGEQDS